MVSAFWTSGFGSFNRPSCNLHANQVRRCLAKAGEETFPASQSWAESALQLTGIIPHTVRLNEGEKWHPIRLVAHATLFFNLYRCSPRSRLIWSIRDTWCLKIVCMGQSRWWDLCLTGVASGQKWDKVQVQYKSSSRWRKVLGIHIRDLVPSSWWS